MERRNFIAALVAVPAMGLLAACGSDSTGDSLQPSDTTPSDSAVDAPPATTATPSTEPSDEPEETDVPGDGVFDEVVLSYTTPGGFTTREFAFQTPPIAIVTGDGTLISRAAPPAVFPGPLIQQHQVRAVSPAGIELLLAAAESAGLFAEIDYTSEDGLVIADAATAVLTISAGGTTYTHEAYALGIGGPPGSGGTESTPERQALLDFLVLLDSDPAAVFGADNLGSPTDYEPTGYQISVVAMAGVEAASDAVVVAWPADSTIDLASATECVEVERAVVADLFEQATQQTFFEQDGVTYQVTPRPAYPGSSC